MLNLKTLVKIHKSYVYELLSIIGDDGVRDPKATHYAFPHELLYLLRCDRT